MFKNELNILTISIRHDLVDQFLADLPKVQDLSAGTRRFIWRGTKSYSKTSTPKVEFTEKSTVLYALAMKAIFFSNGVMSEDQLRMCEALLHRQKELGLPLNGGDLRELCHLSDPRAAILAREIFGAQFETALKSVPWFAGGYHSSESFLALLPFADVIPEIASVLRTAAANPGVAQTAISQALHKNRPGLLKRLQDLGVDLLISANSRLVLVSELSPGRNQTVASHCLQEILDLGLLEPILQESESRQTFASYVSEALAKRTLKLTDEHVAIIQRSDLPETSPLRMAVSKDAALSEIASLSRPQMTQYLNLAVLDGDSATLRRLIANGADPTVAAPTTTKGPHGAFDRPAPFALAELNLEALEALGLSEDMLLPGNLAYGGDLWAMLAKSLSAEFDRFERLRDVEDGKTPELSQKAQRALEIFDVFVERLLPVTTDFEAEVFFSSVIPSLVSNLDAVGVERLTALLDKLRIPSRGHMSAVDFVNKMFDSSDFLGRYSRQQRQNSAEALPTIVDAGFFPGVFSYQLVESSAFDCILKKLLDTGTLLSVLRRSRSFDDSAPRVLHAIDQTPKLLETLLASSIDLNARVAVQDSPLFFSLLSPTAEMSTLQKLRRFKDAGADLSAWNAQDESVLFQLARYHLPETVAAIDFVLAETNLRLDSPNARGEIPAIIALRQASVAVGVELMQRTPLPKALESTALDLVATLVRSARDTSADGSNPIQPLVSGLLNWIKTAEFDLLKFIDDSSSSMNVVRTRSAKFSDQAASIPCQLQRFLGNLAAERHVDLRLSSRDFVADGLYYLLFDRICADLTEFQPLLEQLGRVFSGFRAQSFYDHRAAESISALRFLKDLHDAATVPMGQFDEAVQRVLKQFILDAEALAATAATSRKQIRTIDEDLLNFVRLLEQAASLRVDTRTAESFLQKTELTSASPRTTCRI